ncbi:MAG TPA: adenosylcobinamide-GDP ribazoletransferase [Streptosporangiaceae bacterium]|nr:adenosylcobinamide-GDP ribazoletransferase [Streptosporangiaceae bacterium]
MTSAPSAAPWRAAVSLFTIVPVGGPAEIDRAMAGRIVFWLPVIGGVLGVLAAAGMLAVEATGHGLARRLLAATVALAILGVLTGCLHLDGLADTADGLGSRKPKDQALDIMRKSDIGPMGVSALVFVLLVDLFALAALPAGWVSAIAIATAAITGRAAVVLATALPPARPEGFGALIAGAAPRRTQGAAITLPLAVVLAAAAATGGPMLVWRAAAAILAGLGAVALLAHTARRRLGGTTGDVFGAMIEVAAAAVLLVFALVS